ncbi:MAG: hypothetical protein FWD57_15635, partial [Polyangiaceae bacterium]|nr:hypothetical protein [Polyangiaceae bacterium]
MNPLCFSTNNSDACGGSAGAALRISNDAGAVALLVGIAGVLVAVCGGCSKTNEDYSELDGAPGLSSKGDSGADDGLDAEDSGDEPEAEVGSDAAESGVPDAEDAADSADAEDAEAETDGSGDAAPDGPTGPPSCGNGWRDHPLEECDDGVGPFGISSDRACTGACVVTDRLAWKPYLSGTKERWLGIGRHQVAGGIHGHAVVMMELVGDAGDEARVAVAMYTPLGLPYGGSSWGPVPLEADPVIAALPNGDYAVAHTAFGVDGDGLGIALVRVSKTGSVVQQMGAANTTWPYAQHSPDLFWTGTSLTVAWEDESTIPRRVCTRRFDENLVAAGGESCIWEFDPMSRVSLQSLVDQPVISYRVDGYGESFHRVHMPGGGVFETAAMPAPAFEETIAILPLDDCTVLGAYVDGDQVMTASVFNDKGVELDGPLVFGGPR